mgnify:CR=1 FL=1
MADNLNAMSKFRYKIEMTYLDLVGKRTYDILNESIKSVIIDHNYDNNCMPILFVNMNLDKSLIDNMILNMNNNLITLALYKYDELSNEEIEIECFRKKFIYFLPDDINKNDSIDYNEANTEQHSENTFKAVTVGMICLDHINNNKRSLEIAVSNCSMYDCVKYCISHIDNVLIEPFFYNDTFDQLIMPSVDSVNKALQFLNNYRVFYQTPYRYYLDFNEAYIISSNGMYVKRKGDKYGTIVFKIKDILNNEANDPGIITNNINKTYEINVNSLDTFVYDNTIINKSKNKIKGITSTGSSLKSLKNTSTNSAEKIQNIRVNNDNSNMIENIEAQNNTSNAYINIQKTGLDTALFTINKRYSISNIDKYQSLDGYYLLSRKREIYMREDSTFNMSMVLNFRKIYN